MPGNIASKSALSRGRVRSKASLVVAFAHPVGWSFVNASTLPSS
jgi:hypothetical protein